MISRFLLALALAAFPLSTISALAQDTPAPTSAGKPDACALMPRSDLVALFPGMEVGSKKPILSPLYMGLPQFTQSCMYSVKLPSPTSKMFLAHLVSLVVVYCDPCNTKAGVKTTAAQILAYARDSKEKEAANPSLQMTVTSLPGVGDDAFTVTSSFQHEIHARKDDLVFMVTVDKYSPQMQANGVALAAQAARRWRGGVGMVQAAAPIAPNMGVDQPPDTRVRVTAAPDKWPDACSLLTPADVHAVFGDMTVSAQQRTMGKLRFLSQIDQEEPLPHPVACTYIASKSTMINGQRQLINYIVKVAISDVSTTEEYAAQRFRRLSRGETPLPGVGDDASFNQPNEMISIRKGTLTVWVKVVDDDRDQARHADTLKRQEKLARLVAARMP